MQTEAKAHGMISLKVKSAANQNWASQKAHQAGTYLGFLWDEGWDGILVHCKLPHSSLSGCPKAICWFPFIHLGGERHCESKVFYLRTQCGCTDQGWNAQPSNTNH